MSNTCGCSRPTRDGYVICDTCKGELEQHLAEMRWLDTQLDVSLTRTHAVDYNRSGGRSATTPLPWDERAARVRDALKAEMVGWVRIMCAEGRLPGNTLPDLAAWLLSRLERIAKRDDAWVVSEGIISASIKARAIVFAKPADRHFIGPCEGAIGDEGEVTEVECVGEIWVRDGASVAECSECRRVYSPEEVRRAVQVKLEDQLLTSTEIAHLAHRTFGQPAAKVQKIVAVWASPKRRRLIAHSRDARGTALYRYGDAAELLADTYGERNA